MTAIAIVGIANLFPGSDTPEQFWQNLSRQQDNRSEVKPERQDAQPHDFDGNKGDNDKHYCHRGGYIEDFTLQSHPYGISADQLQQLDCHQQWLIQVCQQALADANIGLQHRVLAQAGLVLGALSFPTQRSNDLYLPLYHQAVSAGLAHVLQQQGCIESDKFSLDNFQQLRAAGPENGLISGYGASLVAKALGLGQGHYALDAACASSLYSVKLACDALKAGRSDIMLAAAVSGSDPFFINMGFSIFQAYPENGVSAPFDTQSQGLFAGEGAGVLVLKRLEDAQANNDRIYATIEGVGLSNDGRGQFVLSPNSKGQVLAYQRAYQEAAIDKSQVQYVECHATGTPLGDKVELNSMAQFFGSAAESPKIGSVKGNIGHLLTAAGMPSILKTVMAMQHGSIPASIGIQQAIASADNSWGEKQLLTQHTPWPQGDKLAGVSAFGFGGCNAHLLIRAYDEQSGERHDSNHKQPAAAFAAPCAMNVIGASAHFSGAQNLQSLQQAVQSNTSLLRPLPAQRWKGLEQILAPQYHAGKTITGGFIDHFELDFMRFKVPPNEDDRLIPQQLLLMKVADQAIRDAALAASSNVAVLVAMSAEAETHQFRGRVNLQTQVPNSLAKAGISLTEKEQQALQRMAMDSVLGAAKLNQYTSFIGNIMASRVSSLWDFSGPAFTISAEEHAVFNTLQVAQDLLTNGEVDAVVVAAVDLAGSAENYLLRQELAAQRGLAYHGCVGEGAGALVLTRACHAENEDKLTAETAAYAVIDGLRFKADSTSNDAAISPLLTALYQDSRQQPDFIDVAGADNHDAQQRITQSVKQMLPSSQRHDISTLLGHTYAASGMASLLNIIIQLQRETALPASKANGLMGAVHQLAVDGCESHISLRSAKISKPISSAKMAPQGLIKSVQLGGPAITQTIIEQGAALLLSSRKQNKPTHDSGEALSVFAQQLQDSQCRHWLGANSRSGQAVPKPRQVIWDYDDLVEYSEGSIAKVFGPDYAIIDSYARRVRLPTTDYLLVTRVTKLDAEINQYRPSTMTTEYDIPVDAPYLVDGQIPWAVAVESGQCDLMLISYLGIDFENKGERVYRLLDCTLTFLGDLPKGGETLRYDISINHFARNGDTLLFFFSYECFVGDEMILKMDGGCAGFFTDQELADGKGVIKTQDELDALAKINKTQFTPLLSHSATSFDTSQIRHLISGDVHRCFGDEYATDTGSSLCFSSDKFLMIEQVKNIQVNGGAWGLGELVGEKQLAPDHWYFPCHFKDDQVMAGSLMAEGCGQLLQFYMMYLGLHTLVDEGRFQPLAGAPQKVRCRGQVLPQTGTLVYRMQVTEIGTSPMPYAKADIDILLNGKVVVDFKNLGVTIKGKPKRLPGLAPLMAQVPDTQAAKIKGVTPLQHVAAPMSHENRVPDTLPFTPYHLFEFATGDICNCFGEEFRIYDGLIPPRTPCGDLQLTTRVIDVQGQRGDLKNTASCVAEYDVPTGAWYFNENSFDQLMPYSVLMEISLQPNGFISGYMGTTLGFPGTELFFRNLDGQGELLRKVNLAGKTITNESLLLSTVIAGSNIIQSFEFVLSTDGEPFYKGSAVFGYFKEAALTHQLGLDNGQAQQPWYLQPANQQSQLPQQIIDLTDANHALFQASEQQPHYRLAGGRLNFVDKVVMIPEGGSHGLGYLHAERQIDPTDWFFQFHFHQDPVMPGSLGVEAIIEVMQVYALQRGLGQSLPAPRFSQILSNIKWKYRGQINPLNKSMSLNVHITDIQQHDDHFVLIANADLSKDGLRIYEVTDVAIAIESAQTETEA
ncbi:hotdog fold thioesterase [Motilimonas pumila]|uniref:3-hydroxyacyl-[acyl-carrier-protein] dehydratase FabA n=1 Tax=Motilimonas pumila TaxID=2303987 RepID=A0A418YB70_9GAMM|nr:beta-ketoacyl synthase N-terminal-like domain-containing protein [Motilimonas pumila]RJG40166.1 3-hydroxyacyl-[acyl-carrier-protein] dehydratase FabA [Motilimonas pumila]